MKKNTIQKSIVLPLLLLVVSACIAQNVSFKYLKGKWTDPDKDDPISYFNFLSDSTLIIRYQNENKKISYKLDSFHNEQRIIISLFPGDTLNYFMNFIRRIDNDKIVLQDYSESPTGKWEKE